jgi:hypothetical protein
MDSNAILYVADFGGNLIRKISTAGIVTTYVGSGQTSYADGIGTNVGITSPAYVVLDSMSNLYTSGGNRVVKISTSAVVTTLAGSGPSGYADGMGSAASFNYLMGIDIDSRGNLYVSDWNNNRIRKVTSSGVVTTVAGSGVTGYADGTLTSAILNGPYACKLDVYSNIIVGDYNDYRVRQVTAAGPAETAGMVSTIGPTDGISISGSIFGIFVDSSNSIYVTGSSNLIQKISTGAKHVLMIEMDE